MGEKMAQMAKTWPKNRKWPSARNGQKWPKNGEKIEKWPQIPIVRNFWANFRPVSIFRPIFPIFGFRAVFHSVPGGLTRKTSTNICHFTFKPLKKFSYAYGVQNAENDLFGPRSARSPG